MANSCKGIDRYDYGFIFRDVCSVHVANNPDDGLDFGICDGSGNNYDFYHFDSSSKTLELKNLGGDSILKIGTLKFIGAKPLNDSGSVSGGSDWLVAFSAANPNGLVVLTDQSRLNFDLSSASSISKQLTNNPDCVVFMEYNPLLKENILFSFDDIIVL